ncbi:MAG: hypothetical protein IPM29_32810 [Planctomycetes bacterium]|nr:hypothetical protein [Planctomycetota bacterium]
MVADEHGEDRDSHGRGEKIVEISSDGVIIRAGSNVAELRASGLIVRRQVTAADGVTTTYTTFIGAAMFDAVSEDGVDMRSADDAELPQYRGGEHCRISRNRATGDGRPASIS